MRVKATIVSFVFATDYGFAETEDGTRLYVKGSCLTDGSPRKRLVPGTEIECEVVQQKKGPAASNVAVLLAA